MHERGWWTTPAAPWRRWDTAAILGLVALVAVRWSDRARWLLSWDANTFALALERYDVHALHPHAPGYPVYVALARIVHVAIRDANDALVALSLLFTAAAIAGAYALGRALAGRGVGLAAATLLLAAPVAYVHSVTANAYAAEMACSVLVAWAAWGAHHAPTPRRVAVLAFALAASIGVRPSLAIYLGPVAAWAALRPPWDLRAQARRLVPAALVGVAVCLAWFVPMTTLSGGYAAWREANRLQSAQVVFAATLYNAGWPALVDNLERLRLFLRWELAFVAPAVSALLLVGVVHRHADPWPRPRWGGPGVFLALWLAPASLFFATVYSGFNEGPSGYVLAVLPGLLLAACMAGAWGLRRLAWTPRAAGALAAAALLLGAGGLALHRYDVADVGYKEHDAWAERWSHLPEAFPPSNSSIVALWNFAFVWTNFPDYTTYNYRPPGQGPGEFPPVLLVQEAKDHEATPDWYDAVKASHDRRPHPLPDGTRHLVLFDFQLAGENGGPRRVLPDVTVREAFLPDGWRVLVVDTTSQRPNLEDYFSADPAGVPWPQ